MVVPISRSQVSGIGGTPTFRVRDAEGSAEAADTSLRVLGDADRLYQLLLILLDNALRYTPAPGSVRVSC